VPQFEDRALIEEVSILAPLSVESHPREVLRARNFVLAVRREVLVPMSKQPETDGLALNALNDSPANGTIEALKALIAQLLPNERLTIERVASRLGMSVRTLQRRLREWGYSFKGIVDDTRRRVAIARLTAGEPNITETAFLLGYSDLAHFTRAFRRWTGTTPRKFAPLPRAADSQMP
jgi:AraC-like DNA-binding protein